MAEEVANGTIYHKQLDALRRQLDRARALRRANDFIRKRKNKTRKDNRAKITLHPKPGLKVFREFVPNNSEDRLRIDIEEVVSKSAAIPPGLIPPQRIAELTQDFVSRLVREASRETLEPVAERAPPSAIPTTWEEAKDQVPRLIKWEEAKAAATKANVHITIVDHLRDTERGYGKWVLQPPGLPRQTFFALDDEPAYRALYAFLSKKDPETGERNQLPADLHLPTKRALTDILAERMSPRDRPAHVDWALRARNRRSPAR